MPDADVPREGNGFACAFNNNGADAGAAFDLFDTDELGFRSSVGTVEADAHILVSICKICFVHLVAEGGGQYLIGF